MGDNPFTSGSSLIISDSKLGDFTKISKHGLFHFAQPFLNIASCLQALCNKKIV